MSAFDRLPNELIIKIYLFLKEDSSAIKSLLATCKRLCYIAWNLLPWEPEWIQARSIPFNPPSFGRDFVSYNTLVDELNEVRYVPCNTITFKRAHLVITRFPMGDTMPPESCMGIRFERIVELRLINCTTTTVWLTTVLNYLPNIVYLTFKEASIIDKGQPIDVTPRRLTELRIIGDRSLDDQLFFRMFSKLAPALLDLTGSQISCDKMVTKRFYGSKLRCYSDFVLTLDRIMEFVKQSATEHLILDCTPIKDEDLIELAENESLKRLRISAMRCEQLTRKSLEFIETSALCGRVKASKPMEIYVPFKIRRMRH